MVRAVMYDAALLFADRSSAVPVTASPTDDEHFVHHAVYGEPGGSARWLSDRGADSPSGAMSQRKRRAFEVARHAILENAPTFEQASFKEILLARRHCAQELAAFRVEMNRLATLMSTSTSGDDAESARDVVSKEITPIVADIERRVRLSRARWAKRVLDKLTSVPTLATFASTVLIGLPLSASLVVAMGLAGIQAGADAYFEGREIRAGSGFSLLLKLKGVPKRTRVLR